MKLADPARDLRAILMALYLLGLAIGPRLDEDSVRERRLPVVAWEWRGVDATGATSPDDRGILAPYIAWIAFNLAL
jgi:hypothetical protein